MSRNGKQFSCERENVTERRAMYTVEKHKQPVIVVTWRGLFWLLFFGTSFGCAVIWAAHYLMISR